MFEPEDHARHGRGGGGYSASNIAFGSGGGLLQKVDRDTQKWTFKCCSAEIPGRGRVDVSKDPATDPGKRSKAGRLDLICRNGKFETVVLADAEIGLPILIAGCQIHPMERLRCGVILLPAFIKHLHGLCATREDGLLPAIDYIRCADGPREGDSWWSLTWTSDRAVRASNLFKVGEYQIYISPQTQEALKHRYIDFRTGGVFVG